MKKKKKQKNSATVQHERLKAVQIIKLSGRSSVLNLYFDIEIPLRSSRAQ